MVKMELGFFVWVIIFLELGICSVATNSSSLGCVERERRALLSFRATLSDPSNTLFSWNSNNKDCCSWEAVACHEITGHVITLDLTQGKKPLKDRLEAERVDSSLLELKHLIHLDLSCIDFSYHKFPAYLGLLKHLQFLNLSGTYFSGAVPQNLGNLSSLRALDLRTGGVSEQGVDDLMWASRLSSLEHLDMSGVNLSMTMHVFEVLTAIPSLRFLSLSGSGLDNSQLPNSCVNSTLLVNLQHLDLGFNSFHGEFPCFLHNMTSLQYLDLSLNIFNHSSGMHLLGLRNLTYFNLADNLFDENVDWISEFLGDKFHLKSLDFSGNSIYGDISGIFKNFSSHKVESLSLESNNFFGEFPQQLGKFSALTFLDISSNKLSGQLASSLGNLISLRTLILSENRLSGEIPISMGELSNLESIDISYNCFEATLSEAHFAKLSKLQKLDASFNNMVRFGMGYDWVPPFQLKYLVLRSSKMRGQFPQWLRTQKTLDWLDLSNCSITGSLPAGLQYMKSLTVFDLSLNYISGPIPELSSSLSFIDISDNMITHLPRNIGNMIPRVDHLNLARNLINGSIPDSLCLMKELTHLDLSKNHLSGNLPSCWANLSSINVVSLSYNVLTGVIPESIGGASLLWRLHLDGNRLTGKLPYTLINCNLLELLDVGENNLSGNLPLWIGRDGLQSLQFLILQNNDFSGTIPRELCQLSELHVLDLAKNNLTGNIPHCFANFSGMMFNHRRNKDEIASDSLNQVMKGMELEYKNFWYVINLDLSSNHLVGGIPSELTTLVGLVGLNLSHNHLKGHIPAKIGDLGSLESLDLSNNNLVGEIPESLSSLSFLSHLNLSNNDLYGQIPTGRQLQTLTDPSIYDGNPLLCGSPLQRKCGIPPDVQSHEEEEGDEDRGEKIWFYGIIIAGFATGFWAVIGVMVVKTKWRQAYFRYIEVVMAKMLGY